jgi:hypothetical protein
MFATVFGVISSSSPMARLSRPRARPRSTHSPGAGDLDARDEHPERQHRAAKRKQQLDPRSARRGKHRDHQNGERGGIGEQADLGQHRPTADVAESKENRAGREDERRHEREQRDRADCRVERT